MWSERRSPPPRRFRPNVSRARASLALAALVAVVWLILPAVPAEAHAALPKTDPPVGAAVARGLGYLSALVLFGCSSSSLLPGGRSCAAAGPTARWPPRSAPPWSASGRWRRSRPS